MLLPLLLLALPAQPQPLPSLEAQVDNLRAFAVLYGHVRFFHPSDEAARVDWERFALLGASVVRSAESSSALKESLRSLFEPIAPTVRILSEGETPKDPVDLRPDGTMPPFVVAWQHLGVGLGNPGVYDSIRTHRLGTLPGGGGFGTIAQVLPAAKVRGKRIALRAAVRTEVAGPGNQGQLWLRVDREERRTGFFDNMADRPILTDRWSVFELAGTVDEDALQLAFGGFLHGEGSVWLDAFELLVQEADGTWSPLPVVNGSFEAEDELVGWFAETPGYAFRVTEQNCFDGRRCAFIEAQYPLSSPRLFDSVPEVGEIASAALSRGLHAEVPLALLGDDARTYGGRVDVEEGALGALLATVASFEPDRGDATSLRLAAVVIVWNVFQHFYPYFDVVDTDWDRVLTDSLRETLDATGEADFYLTLKRLAAALHDGHAYVHHAGLEGGKAYLPVAVDWIEGEVVVTRSEVPDVIPGDVISSVDGVAARRILEGDETLISGSPQWRRSRALADFGRGREATAVELTLRLGSARFQRGVTRNRAERLRESRPDPIVELSEGIYYVDLTRAPMEAIREVLDELAAAKGVVFDVRGYPEGNHDVLRHLIDVPVRSAKWMVPRSIYPNREKLAGYRTSGRWYLTPVPPRIRAKVVFLTNASAISYAESVMGIVEHYRLGEIVGQPTAGANGNVNPFTLPGGYRVGWTGMRVLKHDDRQHHLVGIVPTAPVVRSIAAVRRGRDEYLEKALEFLR